MTDTHIPVPPLEYPNKKSKPPRKRKAGRIFRGYLMVVGALTTLVDLVELILWLLVQIETVIR